MKYDLIIFDCDGTLVDSEILSNSLIATMLREIGIATTDEECIALFKGKSFADIENYIDQKLDHQLEFNFQESFRQRSRILFEAELEPIKGAEAFIQSLGMPICVASNGPQIKMKTTLSVTGLDKYFPDGTIFSAYDFQTWKPEPRLFLEACRRMGSVPEKTLVIEDTVVGGIAAQRANMDFLIYDHENTLEFKELGFRTFNRYEELNANLDLQKPTSTN